MCIDYQQGVNAGENDVKDNAKSYFQLNITTNSL